MKKLIFIGIISLFLFSCGNNPSSSNAGCNSDLAGTWELTVQGAYAEADCSEATNPPTTPPSFAIQIVLAEDCSFISNAVSFAADCTDESNSNYLDYCTGTWLPTETTVVLWPQWASNVIGTSLESTYTEAFTYLVNEDKTSFTQNTQSMDFDGSALQCQYVEYTKIVE